MKKIFYIIGVIVGLAGFASCGDDNYVTENNYYVSGNDSTSHKTDSTGTKTATSNVTNPDSVGTATKPTDWVAITDIDPTGFMIITMDSTGTPTTINDDDMLVAFVGKECRGVATPYKEKDGVTRYSMVISQCANSESDGDDDIANEVELRYYSQKMHRIYIADKIDFTPGSILGDIKEGYKTKWK